MANCVNLQVDVLKIVDIFAKSDTGIIYAVKWDVHDHDELDRILEFLTDVYALYEFFKENEKDLFSGFHNNITIPKAVLQIRKEALAMKKELLELDESGKSSNYDKPSLLFKPLSLSDMGSSDFSRHKAYGYFRKSMIRIYAVQLKEEVFLVTGGAIKLTRTMQERPHTLLELQKLKRTIDYLKEEGIYL